jgi:hypothetical protein
VKRVGEHPRFVALVAGDAALEIVARAENRALAVGPFA